MSKSETVLLRIELAKMAKQYENFQNNIVKRETESTTRILELVTEIDHLKLELAERDRRLSFYENTRNKVKWV